MAHNSYALSEVTKWSCFYFIFASAGSDISLTLHVQPVPMPASPNYIRIPQGFLLVLHPDDMLRASTGDRRWAWR
jgi:hypothetical protein